LAGGVEDGIDQRGAILVFVGEDIAGDFDEIGLEFAFVPLLEDLVHFIGGEAEALAQDMVGFADELHIAVFDAVMDHFDVMTGAVFADPFAAGGTVGDLGGDGLEDGLDVWPGGGAAAGHDRRAVAGAFFAAGHAGADVEESFGLDVLGAADGVLEERVTAVDDDIAGLEVGQEEIDELIDGAAGFDHEHDAAGAFERLDHFLDGMGAEDLGTAGFISQEFIDFGDGAVIGDHGEAVIVHIEDEVLAHDGQTNNGDISGRFHGLGQSVVLAAAN